ncbi:hypothetical protein EV193_11086 [Herbihabitans rhizosphaerae]|uniref:Uncharacterized protein n=1 Tax=Herbihabitans rhizosphaerae TaxID=1872711 RepID=A0A4Q7KJ92_9PSEU|nr:hypothetical protein [Herbihabitans rhizosphaerae]RZS33936.1 hypothetical protein EV193_11086 [Herbihabitans rhizosphaerae]
MSLPEYPTITRDTSGSRSTTVLVWCAAASVALLFTKASNLFEIVPLTARMGATLTESFATYAVLAAPAIALVVWQLTPRRGWPWLLLAGAVLAAPASLMQVWHALYADWMDDILIIATGAAPAFTVAGLCGAATVLWQAGNRAAGGTLVGATLVVQLVAPVVLMSGGFDARETIAIVGLVLVVPAIVGAAITVSASTVIPSSVPVRPDLRTTIAGAVAAVTPALFPILQPSRQEMRSNPDTISDYFLYCGLIALVIAIAAGMAAGLLNLLASAALGLLLGAFGMMIMPSVEVLREFAVVAIIAAIGSVVIGVLVAQSRWRFQIGMGGLALVVVGLFVFFLMVNSDDVRSYRDFLDGATPVLVVIGVIAALSTVTSVGSVVARRSDTPAIVVGLTVPFTVAVIGLITWLMLTAPDDKAPLTNMLPASAAGVLIAGVLVAMIVNRYGESQRTDHRPGSDTIL